MDGKFSLYSSVSKAKFSHEQPKTVLDTVYPSFFVTSAITPYIWLTMTSYEHFKLTGALGNASHKINPPTSLTLTR